jgi:hypothetical protein
MCFQAHYLHKNKLSLKKIHIYEFIARLIVHIPESNFKYIRFYGAYHNSTMMNIE